MSYVKSLPRPALGALIAVGVLCAPALAASAPMITSASPAKGAVFAERSVTLAATATDTACMKVSVEDDTTRAQIYSEFIHDTSFSRPISLPVDGHYRAVISATADGSCNFGSASTTTINRFDVDTTPPAPFALVNQTRVCPGGSCFLSGPTSLDLEWNRADDIGGITHYEVLVNGAEHARTQARRYSLPMSGIPNLSVITVVAVDIAGNRREASPSAPVLHDISAPSVRWFAPQTTWLRGRVHLGARVADDAVGSGVARLGFTTRKVTFGVEPRADIGLVQGPFENGAEELVALGTGKMHDGRQQITAFAVDEAGNVSHATKTFTVDNTRPKFTNRARIMKVSAKRSLTKVPVRISDELSPRLVMSYVVRDTKRSTKSATLKRAQAKAVVRATQHLRSLKFTGTGAQLEAAHVRLANAKIQLRNRYVRNAWSAPDRGTQRVAIPGKSLGVGNYRLTLQVKDLAGNTATRAYTLMVR